MLGGGARSDRLRSALAALRAGLDARNSDVRPRAGRLAVASELYGHGLALDGDTLFIAGRGELWAYRLME